MHVEGSGSRSLSRVPRGADGRRAGKEGLGSASLSPTPTSFGRAGSWFLAVRENAEDVGDLRDSLWSCDVEQFKEY